MTRRGDKVSAFDALEALGQIADLGEGRSTDREETRPEVISLPLGQLFPDPVQARRVLPAVLRLSFLQGSKGPLEILQQWQAIATEDENEAALLQSLVVNLARSLKSQQQINPITVSGIDPGPPDRYLIETGERRWWAHWWLWGIENDARFETIRAVIVDRPSPWRQAAENLQGEPLSAVQEACQVARLLMLEAGQEPTFQIKWGEEKPALDEEQIEEGYGFFRDGVEKRVASGSWPRIEDATGKGRRYCQYLLGLLRLSDGVLALADRAGLTESQLRPLAANERDPDRQLTIAQAIVQFDLGRKDVARLVTTADLTEAIRKLEGKAGQAAPSRSPVIRPPERIVVERLSSMTRLLDRASRSEPEMTRIVAQEVRRTGEVKQRRSELEELVSFLSSLIRELESGRLREES